MSTPVKPAIVEHLTPSGLGEHRQVVVAKLGLAVVGHGDDVLVVDARKREPTAGPAEMSG